MKKGFADAQRWEGVRHKSLQFGMAGDQAVWGNREAGKTGGAQKRGLWSNVET